jgi:hypothetical protein
VRDDISKGPLRDFKTGAGFAGAKLSEILPAARAARFVRMTNEQHRRSCPRCFPALASLASARMTSNAGAQMRSF